MVSLGEKNPTWGVSRWEGRGLRFVPPDDEGFSVRGDKQKLEYKGRRRSHRFTILGDSAFEYDVILNREPESNVIRLRMEGAENFDFFRQPDFVPDLFLKGSYAVYKKETLLGEGTGKLCHIHRPLIIDARGRRVWGDLSVVGNELRISIPEQWLSEAVYPVIVDPTIGTTTIGSQYLFDNDPPEPWVPLQFECDIPVNRFLVPQTINGLCTAYFYSNEDYGEEAGGYPVLYSDGVNRPNAKLSLQESFIDFTLSSSKPKGWRSGTFLSNGSISSGSNIWFGCFTKYFWFPRFDFGGTFENWYWNNENVIPNIYPGSYSNWAPNFKLSMYFDYSSAQNYVRTLTQGVTLTDSRKLTANYKRNSFDTVRVNSTANKLQGFIRKLEAAVQGYDNNSLAFLYSRTVKDNAKVSGTLSHLGAFFRGLFDNAKSDSEAKIGRTYILTLSDTVQAAGVVIRGLLMFVRIVSGLFVRDYLLRRFLIAREEIVLKSSITREITFESRIN
ncbi:MAG: hypothetical protein FWG99_07305 [Treponema sp.]|nr:hypothetical protein [Treponema sp.]